MKQEIKDRLPTWWKSLKGLDAVISNDIDSLTGYYFIKKVFPDVGLKGFFDFETYYDAGSKRRAFTIDLDTLQGRAFGNHMTYHTNPDAINLNNLYNIKYHEKYPLNTVLLILSLYDFDLESFTDEQLKIILAIDSAYKGFYTKNDYFKGIYITWLDRLDIGFLESRILDNMTVQDFKEIQKKYNLSGTLEIVNNRLYTNIDLARLSMAFNDIIELPRCKFTVGDTYNYTVINPRIDTVPEPEDIISIAWTYSDKIKMTLK